MARAFHEVVTRMGGVDGNRHGAIDLVVSFGIHPVVDERLRRRR
jgi:hypothetical protein